MTDLNSFTKREAPTLKATPRQRLPVPVLAETEGTAGVGGFLSTGEKAYVSPRARRSHYFRLHEGYAVSDQILDYLDKSGMAYILIQETDTGNVLEYHLRDFVDFGIPIEHEEADPQTCVPEKHATTWSGHAKGVL
ncbi:hypothetical protein HRTV-25_gp46 [Halorubrum tailed virus 25]|uniref:Uncharacterized protein n=1 Tax=Halorubrum tailed virus 25 TaxID=2878006 RepID=A0AAE8XYS0_9CAUD|nr:hypothetical protein M1M37_gp046 [Halorubrum tailed virus 25]UBF22627.1 hypothetical protein HRTV-25_gp46 [Halorubrum tailed virus 25]